MKSTKIIRIFLIILILIILPVKAFNAFKLRSETKPAIETYLVHHKTEKRFTDYMNEVFREENPIMVIYGAFQNDTHGINPKPENETKAIINRLRPPAKRYEMTGQK